MGSAFVTISGTQEQKKITDAQYQNLDRPYPATQHIPLSQLLLPATELCRSQASPEDEAAQVGSSSLPATTSLDVSLC